MILILKVIEYIVPDDLLEELGIDEMTYDELKALFELFDLDRWHFFVFILSESFFELYYSGRCQRRNLFCL